MWKSHCIHGASFCCCKRPPFIAGGDVRLRHYRVKSMVGLIEIHRISMVGLPTRARFLAGVWSALFPSLLLGLRRGDHAMPLVYDDLFIICQEEVRLHSFLPDRGLFLGDFTNLLCDLCGEATEGFIRLRRFLGRFWLLFGGVRGQGSAIKSFPFVQIVGLKNLS